MTGFSPKNCRTASPRCIPGPVPVYKYLCIWWATTVLCWFQVSWAASVFLSHGISELLRCQTGSLVKGKVRKVSKLQYFIIPGYSLFSKQCLFKLCAIKIYYFCLCTNWFSFSGFQELLKTREETVLTTTVGGHNQVLKISWTPFC